MAGQPFIRHVLDRLDSLPQTLPREFIYITGMHGGQIEDYLRRAYPEQKASFISQPEPFGQSHALYRAREHLTGPLLMVFPDTLAETDLYFLGAAPSEAAVWVREVPDPGSYGIARTGPDGRVRRIIEKPQTKDYRLAVVGFYYFPKAEALVDAIEEQLVTDLRTGEEFYLADAVNLLLDRGLVMRTQPVGAWHDGGTVAGLLETNAYLLENGHANFRRLVELDDGKIVPPVYIDPSAAVEGSVVGPNVSIGAGCTVVNSVIENTIVEAGSKITACRLWDSLVGERAMLSGVTGIISAGDDSFYSFDPNERE